MKRFTIKNYKGNIIESLKNFSKKYPGIRLIEAKEENDSLKIVTEDSKEDELKVLDTLYRMFTNHNPNQYPLHSLGKDPFRQEVLKQATKTQIDSLKKEGIAFLARTGNSNRMKDVAIYLPKIYDDIVFVEVKAVKDTDKLINFEFKCDSEKGKIYATRQSGNDFIDHFLRGKDKNTYYNVLEDLESLMKEKNYTGFSDLTTEEIKRISGYDNNTLFKVGSFADDLHKKIMTSEF